MHCSKALIWLSALILISSAIAPMMLASASMANFDDTSVTEVAVDADSNGLYDLLWINITINVTVPGMFYISANLLGPGGVPSITSAPNENGNQPSGESIISFKFYGTDIRNSWVNGSYRVEATISNDTIVVDQLVYNTTVYTASQFDAAAVQYTGPITDKGVNTDADPRYDLLMVNVTWNIIRAGKYSFVLYVLNDTGAVSITQQQKNVASYPAGSLTLTFSIDGKLLVQANETGHFKFRLGWYSQIENRWKYLPPFPYIQSANSYDPSQFQPPGLQVYSFDETPVDTDSDGFFDAVNVSLHGTINVLGAYAVSMNLYHGSNQIDATNHQIGDLYKSVGHVNITYNFETTRLVGDGMNTTFKLDCFVYEYKLGVWSYLGYKQMFSSASYNSTDFNYKVALPRLVGAPEATAIDSDSDGLYESFNIALNITGGADGIYEVRSFLYEPGTWAQAGQEFALCQVTGGNTTVFVLSFPGWAINKSQISAPYQLSVSIYDPANYQALWEKDDITISNPVLYSDFDGTLPISLSLSDNKGIDTDGNGKYDLLKIELNATFNGETTLSAKLTDGSMSTGWANWNGCANGSWPITFYFGGAGIRSLPLTSPFHLVLQGYDSEGTMFYLPNITIATTYMPSMFETTDMTLLNGTVTDADTGLPIAGATIVGGGNSTVSDAGGDYNMSVASGSVSMTVAASGYNTRTIITYAENATDSLNILLFAPQASDSTVKGFWKNPSGDPTDPEKGIRVLDVGRNVMKFFTSGPNGYYEVPVKSGVNIILFGEDNAYSAASRLTVPANSIMWVNITASDFWYWGEEWDITLTNWSNGVVKYSTPERGAYAMYDAMKADFMCGDSNGIVSEDEVTIYEHYMFGSYSARMMDTTGQFLVNGTYYEYDIANRTFEITGLLGPIESVHSDNMTLTAKMSSNGAIAATGNHTISLVYYYDTLDGSSGMVFRLQLPPGFAMNWTDAPSDANVSGTNHVVLNPGKGINATGYYSLANLYIGIAKADAGSSDLLILIVAIIAVVIVVAVLLVMRRGKKPSPKLEEMKPESPAPPEE